MTDRNRRGNDSELNDGSARNVHEIVSPTDELAPISNSEVSSQPIQAKNPFASSAIMIVDDEPTTIEVLTMFLQGEGYERFITTSDPREAMEWLECERPDVLLLDLMMPHIDGLEILERIRHHEHVSHIPVLILTSSTDAETKHRALELGATDFLGKPVDPSELALRLRNTLAAKAYQDRLAFYDALTGLPNRRFFMDQLGRTLLRAQVQSTECALLHIDLDRFQQINDAIGHSVGDALLRGVAERLELSMRPTDYLGIPGVSDEKEPLSRVGGDEFSLLLPGDGALDAATSVARRILASLSEPFHLAGRDVFVTASIGIALFPGDAQNLNALLANADVAMSYAKKRGRNTYQFYDHSLDEASADRLSLETELRGAVERKELRLHYQPKVDIRTGRIMGCEALMRWDHGELGMIPPDQFIPIAEDADLIGEMGEWALRAACQENKRWQDAGLPPISVAVNVSARQFLSDNFVGTVRSALDDSGLEPRYLTIEMTESLIIENPAETSRMLEAIQRMGAKVSIDDFGTGYSSLASLKRFPIDELKIDRSFMQGVPDDQDSAAIVTAIIAFARVLGLFLVAEGVETEEQRAFLAENGCECFQGYLFSRPIPGDELLKLIAASR